MNAVNRQRFLATFTFIALIIIMVVQVNWLFKTAKFEQKHFNMKVNDALKDARDEIGKRVPECTNMMNYLCGGHCKVDERKATITEIDSIIKSNLEIHNIALDYTFEITDSIIDKKTNPKCYVQSLNGLLQKNGIQIKLQFPGRDKFLFAQIKGAFLLAFFSVLFVAYSFIITLQMFVKERKMAQQTTDFINNLVHEFQTPLSNIRLATNLIRKRSAAETDGKINEYTSVILKENQRLQDHVEEILKVSSNSKNGLLIEPNDIHEIIRSVADDFHHKLLAADGTLKLNLKAPVSTINSDNMQISLIFSNLIDNAIKYSTAPPVITISTSGDEKDLIIKVADNGIGIDKSEHSKIFEKYYRISTGDLHNVKGFGLGLTYVKKIVESYNGKIKVSSIPEKGTTFTITLPLQHE